MKRETNALKSLMGVERVEDEDVRNEVKREESPELKSNTDVESSGIWPSNATSPSSILLSQYSMLGAESLSEWQKALEVSVNGSKSYRALKMLNAILLLEFIDLTPQLPNSCFLVREKPLSISFPSL